MMRAWPRPRDDRALRIGPRRLRGGARPGGSLGDVPAEWQALLDLGMLWAARDYERTHAYYQQALDLARTTGDPLLLARSLNRLGNWQMNMDYQTASQASHEEALRVLEQAGDQRGIAETLDFLGMTMAVRGDLHASTACYRRAIALFRQLGDYHGLASAVTTMSERGGTIGDQLVVPETTLAEAIRDAGNRPGGRTRESAGVPMRSTRWSILD